MIEILVICGGAFLIALLLSSTSLLWVYLITIISFLINIVLLYAVLPLLLFHFIWWRYLYITNGQRRLDGSFEKVNYDDVDEQEIMDINKFKRVKTAI
jgi:hypothetical protein